MDRFDALYGRYGRAVLAYALRRADAATAEDVAAQVSVAAWRRLDHIPAEAELPWLYGAARRVLANERRSARRRAVLSDALRLAARDPPDTPGERSDDPLLEALACLRAGDREVLMLTAWEGLAADEAAVVLGCSVAAVHTRLHRARGRLERQLEMRSASGPSVLASPADSRSR